MSAGGWSDPFKRERITPFQPALSCVNNSKRLGLKLPYNDDALSSPAAVESYWNPNRRRRRTIADGSPMDHSVQKRRAFEEMPLAFGRAVHTVISLAVAIVVPWHRHIASDSPFKSARDAVRACYDVPRAC